MGRAKVRCAGSLAGRCLIIAALGSLHAYRRGRKRGQDPFQETDQQRFEIHQCDNVLSLSHTKKFISLVVQGDNFKMGRTETHILKCV